MLLLLFLGKESLQFHQLLNQKSIQLSSLQSRLLGPGEAASQLHLTSSSSLTRDRKILEFQNALPFLLADRDQGTISFSGLLKDGLQTPKDRAQTGITNSQLNCVLWPIAVSIHEKKHTCVYNYVHKVKS